MSLEIVIDIGNGYPSPDVLPNRMIKNATMRLFETHYDMACEGSDPPLAYGDDTLFYRNRLASMLTAHSGRDFVDPNLLVPNAGVSHGLDLMCTMFLKDKPNVHNYFVYMEATSYFLTMGMFKDHNLEVRPISTDEDGVCVDELAEKLKVLYEENDKLPANDRKFPLFLYIIPEFHNPTGSCLSDERRQKLVQLAAQYGLMVVGDEVYQMLDITSYVPRPINHHSPNPLATVVPDVIAVTQAQHKKNILPEVPEPLHPLPPLPTTNTLPFRSLSAMGSPHVITISSFSKILSPGLRVGWIEFPSKEWVAKYDNLRVVQSTGSICHFASSVVALLMDDSLKAPINPSLVALDVFNEDESTCPLYSHLHNLRIIYGIKYQVLTSALVKHSHQLLRHLVDDAVYNSTEDAEYLPCGFSIAGFRRSERIGGYFIWIKLPDWCSLKAADLAKDGVNPDAINTPTKLWKLARTEYNLVYKQGNECAVDDSEEGAGFGYMRMCFAR
jgi:DNA-binding transcriptional MocR family regulator